MKFLASVSLTALLAFVCGLYFPWWTIAFASFLTAFSINQPAGKSFLSGALGVFLLWLLLTSVINKANDSIISTRMASVLPMGGSVFWLVMTTCVIGALIGGFGALTGSLLRKLLHPAG